MARTPLRQGQQHYPDDGKDAFASMITKTPLQQEQQR
jgi:hypothetical protein